MNNKVYFENEEEAKEFFDKTATVGNNSHQDKKRSFIFNCERFGYIKKSDLEIAREKWEESCRRQENLNCKYDRLKEYMFELEKALEEK